MVRAQRLEVGGGVVHSCAANVHLDSKILSLPKQCSIDIWILRRHQPVRALTARYTCSQGMAPHQVQAGVRWHIRVAEHDAELRALAYLRASCFCKVQAGTSEFAQRVRAPVCKRRSA